MDTCAVFLAMALLFWGVQAVAEISPRVVKTHYETPDLVVASVLVDGAPETGGDAAGVVQSAIDEVAEAGGGVVFLTEGHYRLEAPIVVRAGVTLRGDWPGPGEVAGTVLMPVSGRGEAEGPPALTIECGAGLREMTVWYPEQRVNDIVPYPWTLRTSSRSGPDNFTVMNVTLVNPYQAFKTGPGGNELHTIRNVYGTPLKTGIWIDTCTDIGRVIGVHFGPECWEGSGLPNAPVSDDDRTALRAHLLAEAVGVDMGRSDWEYLYDLNVAGYGVGLKLRRGAHGTTNAVMFGSAFDDCTTALLLEELNGIGLSCTGCRFAGMDASVSGPDSFHTVAQFNTCEFGGPVVLTGKGTLTFQHCDFESANAPAVKAYSGSVSVLGSTFGAGTPHVNLGSDVRRARLLGNVFAGAPSIVNDAADGDVMIAHGAMAFERPKNVVPDYSAPHPRPVGDGFVNVLEHGAVPEGEDNTSAFQAALDAAGQVGGGTVYVPAGNYRFAGTLTVPTGVELRGSSDVPHHTISGGSVLMPIGGKNDEDGTPFLRLQQGSGLRGLTVWYPEQNPMAPTPYPWTVQGLGPGCWLVDVTLGNAYQGVDFWTHPSDGHVIRYLAGAFLRRGLFVSKCDGRGWVEDVQFNPHYSMRLPASLPRPDYNEGSHIGGVIGVQREHLEAMVFGRCADEHLNRNFLYAAYDGLAFRDDGGGTHGTVVMHGTDTGSRALVLEATAESGIEFINTQLVPLGNWEVGALIVDDSFEGTARFFNSQMWAGSCSGLVAGSGRLLIQQLNTLSGGFVFSGGDSRVEHVVFANELSPHIRVEEGCESLELVANAYGGGVLRVDDAAGKCRYLANSACVRMGAPAEAGSLVTGWESGELQGLADTIVAKGGERNNLSEAQCAPTDAQAHGGTRCLRVAGSAGEGHSCVYFHVFDGPLSVVPDTMLTYWFLPANELGRHVAVDLLCEDGTTLRDAGIATTAGVGCHPGQAKGRVGEWEEIRIPLRKLAGKTIQTVMVAFDRTESHGPFEAFVDDFALRSLEPAEAYHVVASMPGGRCRKGTEIALTGAGEMPVCYTLDGSNPRPASALYESPIALDEPGLHELRYAVQREDGSVSNLVFGALYEVEE